VIHTGCSELRKRAFKVHDNSQTEPLESHIEMHEVHCAHPKRGLVPKPNRNWYGEDKRFEFEITGMADAEYAKDTESRQSISGYCTFLEGAAVSAKSKQQRSVMLSTTEAEIMAMTECVQDMIFIKDVLQSIELKVKRPMIISWDNKGAVDNNKDLFTKLLIATLVC
jgi:hypothetical protein